MIVGDKVVLKETISATHMFPKKYEDPDEKVIPAGSIATIEIVYTSGGGITRFEDGTKVMVLNLSEKFVKAIEEKNNELVDNGMKFMKNFVPYLSANEGDKP